MAQSLMNISLALAKKHNAEIIFLHVIEVREGQQLRAGFDEATDAKAEMEEVSRLASDADIPARYLIKVSHRISQGIVDTAIEENCNFVVMGRQKNPDFIDRIFSSLIDTVVQKVPTETAILHGPCSFDNIKTILIPFGTDTHSRLAMEVAPAVADYFNAKIRIAVVIQPQLSAEERDGIIEQAKAMIKEYSLSADLVTVKEHNVLRGIVSISTESNLLLMGGRSGDFLGLLFAKSLTREITEQVSCPVLWIKEYEERVSFWHALLRTKEKGEEQHGR
jgi:nucleotide-binding universal stress UspA family protein